MIYKDLVTAVNTMFDDKFSPLFRSNKTISDSYYLATGNRLSDNVTFFLTSVYNNDIHYRVVLGKSADNDIVNEVMFIQNEQIILCIIPEEVVDGVDCDNDRIIKVLHDMYEFIVDNTIPNVSINTIYGKVLTVMATYLTVYTLNLWFSGFGYSDIAKHGNISEEFYSKILSVDPDYALDYQYIYALLN